MLTDIATAHARGRRLYIGTTNLDAQRLVIWDIGAIAASGHPAALELIRNVILASASIPGLSSMIKSASINDLLRIYNFTQQQHIDFYYSGIPEDFEFESQEIIDQAMMKALFDLGYQRASDGGIWKKAPFE